MTPEDVRRIASLSRLRVADDELAGFTEQFTQIVQYVEKLNEVDTTGVEPMTSVLDSSNVLRDDEPGPMLSPAEALSNAPRRTEGFFSVPKVIGDVAE
ncbi:MAG TPA: Asp-tRNA(Asn)/Glu-tRNA(Gln) amidotransferase subunit GatC [Candidatus Kapabacteria bacterium]|jgi:aspartyl-tRNA(Asn)/glutamyl-tRNA(Gln) amidotransferase subunit C|nr:Asp-tRNA(Asn)/Glu-tRNA(Gln) amidotransferase subunit GatC [Candidatus Kapabacteria bacterium]